MNFVLALGAELVFAGALVAGLSWLARLPHAGEFVAPRYIPAPQVEEGPITLSTDVRGLV